MKVLVFKDGLSKEITGETGKYWLCGEERFRKLGRSFLEVREISVEPKEPENAEAREEAAPEQPKKRAAKKKKKAEVSGDGEHGV